MKGYGGPSETRVPVSSAPLWAYALSLPFRGMEGQAHMLCSLAQPCLTLVFPVLGLGWVAGPFLLALCPPSLSLALPSPCQSVNLPGVLAALESPGRPWAKLRAQGPGKNSQQ